MAIRMTGTSLRDAKHGPWETCSAWDPAIDVEATGVDVWTEFLATGDMSTLKWKSGQEPSRFSYRALTGDEFATIESLTDLPMLKLFRLLRLAVRPVGVTAPTVKEKGMEWLEPEWFDTAILGLGQLEEDGTQVDVTARVAMIATLARLVDTARLGEHEKKALSPHAKPSSSGPKGSSVASTTTPVTSSEVASSNTLTPSGENTGAPTFYPSSDAARVIICSSARPPSEATFALGPS